MLLVGVVTFILCQFPGGPTYLFAFANSWLVPPAILLGLGAIWPRFNSRGAIWGAALGMLTMAVLTILELTKVFVVGQYIYPATLGFIVTLVAAVVASLTGKPKYYGEPGWERVPTATNRVDVQLDDMSYQILEMLRIGHPYMADLTDSLGVDSKHSGAAIETLDKGGYLMRDSLSGNGFFKFTITDKGLAALPPLSEKDQALANEKLDAKYLSLLQLLATNPENQAQFIRDHDIKSMRMAAISSHLTREGYIKEKGLFKRRLEITEKGREAVRKFA